MPAAWTSITHTACILPIVIAYTPHLGFPGGTSGKELTCQCRRHKRHGFNPWVREIPGGGKGNPLQYSCLENPMDRGVWWAIAHTVSKNHAHMRICVHTHTHTNTYRGILLRHKKEWNNAICSNLDRPRHYHTKGSKWERQMSHIYIRNLKKVIQINLFINQK